MCRAFTVSNQTKEAQGLTSSIKMSMRLVSEDVAILASS